MKMSMTEYISGEEHPDLIEDKHWVWYLSYPLLFTVFLVHNLIWGELE